MLSFSGAGGQQGRPFFQIRDGGHALGGEHATTLQLPVLMLIQQQGPHQADDRGVVGKDAHDSGAAFDFFIDRVIDVRGFVPVIGISFGCDASAVGSFHSSSLRRKSSNVA